MIPIILVATDQASRDTYLHTYIDSINLPLHRVFTFDPEETIITIDQARDISAFISRSDFEKVVVIHAFDTAKKETQNALLKTLEEHAELTHFFLTVETSDALLPTIQSRCHVVRLANIESKRKSVTSFNDTYFLEQALNDSAKIKKVDFPKETHKIISYIRSQLRDSILKKAPIAEVQQYSSSLKTALEVKKMMSEYNIQPEFAFDQILFQLYNRPSS